MTAVAISYPPLESTKGQPFLSQNRQFQWTKTNDVIFPVIPASMATLLKSKGYQVYWDDAISENISYQTWLNRLIQRSPDFVFMESKTPVIKKHWQIIKDVKKKLPKTKVILMGDHVTALPNESYQNSPVDKVLIGGNYDFLALEYLTGQKIKPDLETLPLIDRQLCQWQNYAYRNTNFKCKPGAYTMFGRDCWWGRCTFCSWAALFPGNHYQVVSPLKAIEEIQLLQHLGVKEVFDDSGTFPVGEWLEQFCRLMIKSGLNKKIQLGANMRFGALSQNEFNLMKKAGFRFLLFGLESANQTTLNKINKNIRVNNVIPTLTMAQKAGISSHITIMVGYPWENKKDLNKTLAFCRSIFRQGLVASMQATIIVPYPGTPLFNYCRKNNLLTTSNWNKYDMGQPVIKTKVSADYLKQSVRNLFKGIITPRFIFNQITSLKSWADFQHLLFYTIKYFQKLNDFR